MTMKKTPATKVKVKLLKVVTHGDKERQPGSIIEVSKPVAQWLQDRDKAVAV